MIGPRQLRAGLMAAALIISPPARLSGQATTITTEGGMLRVQAPTFRFIEGTVLEHLRDGLSLRLHLEMRVLGDPGGTALATRRHTFTISFDLWEERFATSRAGARTRPTLHPNARAAEAWCIEQLAVPLAELRALRREAPFWLRLDSRMERPDGGNTGGLSLGRLIDALSRRTEDDDVRPPFEAGPFRLP